jgi:SEC-C motif domain protein
MRSRYSAYALGLHAYVLRTWHSSTRPPAIEPANGTRWIALRVLSHTEVDATHAEVAFEATARIQGRATTMRELSRFERADGAADGAWLYVDAVVVPG